MLFKRTLSILSGILVVSSTAMVLVNNADSMQLNHQLQNNLNPKEIIPVFDVSEKNAQNSLYSEKESLSEVAEIKSLPAIVNTDSSVKNVEFPDITSLFTSGNLNENEGRNYCHYYFLYHVIGLDHDTFVKISDVINSGILLVIETLKIAFPNWSTTIDTVSWLLMYHWKRWDIPSYDKGKGVEITFFGPIPSIITSVSSQ